MEAYGCIRMHDGGMLIPPDAHSGIRAWQKDQIRTTRLLSRKNNNSDSKNGCHQRVNKSMNLTFVQCVQERRIDSNPTHYIKFDKSTKHPESNPDSV